MVKHAQAKEAWIDLHQNGHEVTLSIRDDGRGFDPAMLRREGGSHIGTSTMAERAAAIGGELQLNSYPGGGTEVTVRVTPKGDSTPVPISEIRKARNRYEHGQSKIGQEETKG